MDHEEPRHDEMAVAQLAEPLRRRIYQLVAKSAEPVSRDQAADAMGIGRTLAAYHLDRLAKNGLLEATYARPPGRTGAGAGRPAKLYRRAAGEVAVSLPPRDYALAAEILAAAIDEDPSGPTRSLVEQSARRIGIDAGCELRSRPTTSPADATVASALQERGYEPFADGDAIRTRNCPFHLLAQRHRDLACAMNHQLITGLLEGLGESDYTAILEPHPATCCVAIVPRRSRGLSAQA